MLALRLGALPGEPQVAAVIEPDRRALRAEKLQAVIARIVDAGLGVARHDDPCGDEAPPVIRRVGEHRQHGADVEAVAVDLLVRRRALDHHRRQRPADGALDKGADGAEVAPERSLAVELVGQHVADHRHVVAGDVAEQDRGVVAVELLHDGGDLELGIGFAFIRAQAPRLEHAAQRRPEPGIQNVRV
jgi:hypothetical protein